MQLKTLISQAIIQKKYDRMVMFPTLLLQAIRCAKPTYKQRQTGWNCRKYGVDFKQFPLIFENNFESKKIILALKKFGTVIAIYSMFFQNEIIL